MGKNIIQQIDEDIVNQRKPVRKYWENLKATTIGIEDEDEIMEKLAEEDLKSTNKRYTISNKLMCAAIYKYGVEYRAKLPTVAKAYDKKGF